MFFRCNCNNSSRSFFQCDHVNELTHSCCSWNGQDDTGHSYKSKEALQWCCDTSDRCIFPGRQLSHHYDTLDTDVCQKRRISEKLGRRISILQGIYLYMSTLVSVCVVFTCQRSSQSPRQRGPSDRCHSRNTPGASCCSMPLSLDQWWTLLTMNVYCISMCQVTVLVNMTTMSFSGWCQVVLWMHLLEVKHCSDCLKKSLTHHTADSREQTAYENHARSIFCLQTAEERKKCIKVLHSNWETENECLFEFVSKHYLQ